jgi:hypothetical protein
MMVSDSEISPPPPSPWKARARIKTNMFGDSAHAADPVMKMPIETSRVMRRP